MQAQILTTTKRIYKTKYLLLPFTDFNLKVNNISVESSQQTYIMQI